MKRRFRFATADFDFCSLQLSLVAGGVVNFLLAENVIEDEDESTRAGGRGQLPKFGAVEENAQAILWDGSGSGKSVERTDSAMWRCGFTEKAKLKKGIFWSRSI